MESDSEEPVNVEQEREIAVFRSYCALKNVMDAIMFCVENSDHELMKPVQNKHASHSRNLYRRFRGERTLSSSEGEESGSPFFDEGKGDKYSEMAAKKTFENFQQSYQEEVGLKLDKARENLAHLQPMTYRMEILEDIFSLLFLSHEDFCESIGSFEFDSDPDDDDNKHANVERVYSDRMNLSIISEEDFLDDSIGEKRKLSPRVSANSLGSPSKNVTQNTTVSTDYDEPFVEKSSKGSVAASVALKKVKVHAKNNSSSSHLTSISDKNILSNETQKRIISFLNSKQNRPIGFLLNDYLVRDILHFLKNSLSDLNESRLFLAKSSGRPKAKKTASSKVKESIEKALCGENLTTVKDEEILRRSTRLTQFVSEAWWRFQLIVPQEVPKSAHVILPQPVHLAEGDVSLLSSFEEQSFHSEGKLFLKRRVHFLNFFTPNHFTFYTNVMILYSNIRFQSSLLNELVHWFPA